MADDRDKKDSAPKAARTVDAKTPDSEKSGPQKSNMGFGLWATVVLLIAIGAGYLAWPLWRTSALEALHANLPAPVASLLPAVEEPTPKPAPEPAPAVSAPVSAPVPVPEATPAPAAEAAPAAEMTPVPAPASDETARRVAALERALADMAEQVAALTAKLDEQTTLLRAQNESLRAQNESLRAQGERAGAVRADDAARETGLALLLLGQVQTGLMAGAPFDEDLAALAGTLGDDAALAPLIAALEPHAAAGVKTRLQLMAAFDGTARRAAEAIARDELAAAGEAIGGETPGWLARIWEKLSSLVVVRRVGAPSGATGPRATLARAEAAIEAGDLAGARTALEGLDGAPKAAAAGWLGDARARMDAERTFARLKTALLARGQSK